MKTIDITQLNTLPTPLEQCIIIDVRSPSEYAREHIPNSINIPVGQLKDADTTQWKDKTLLFHCKSGARTQQAQMIIDTIECQERFCLDGGIDAWKKSGKSIITDTKAPLELMRQVQIIVGVMITLGLILTYLISPYFLILPAMAGIGMLVAGLTGFCGMANLLMLLPYNKPRL